MADRFPVVAISAANVHNIIADLEIPSSSSGPSSKQSKCMTCGITHTTLKENHEDDKGRTLHQPW